MEAVNLNNLSVDSSGRVVFSGLSSGIDVQGIVTDIIAAKRLPIDSIENRIAESVDQIAALGDLRTLLTGLRQSLSTLRGAVTLGNAGDVFSAKQVFATTSRNDGALPGAAGNLLGVSTTNAAAVGSHTIEVLRVATAHKVASKAFSSEVVALSLTGTFEVTGKGGSATITVSSSDTLQDVRDRINNANTGINGTGVTASIVQTSATGFVLVITAANTGTDMIITDSGSVLSGLGISSSNGAGGSRNGLAPADSKIEAANDGFKQILFDGTQADNSFLISYDQASKVMTLTRGDGTTDTATLSATAIASGATETAAFSSFGVTIVLDENFDKTADILVDADTVSVTAGTGAIDAATIKISDSTGNISAINSTTLTFGNLGTPGAITVTVGGFSGTFDGTSTGTKTVTLSDGSGNSLTVQFDVSTTFDGNETAASIDLQEIENLVAATGTQFDSELQAAQTARFTADGLVDADRFESRFVTSSTNTLSTLAAEAGDPGSFDIKVGSGTVTVNYLGTDTLSGLVTKINAAITAAGGGNAVFDAGTAASLMTDGDGVRLVITDTTGAAIALTDTDGLVAGLGIDNDLVIERDSNTVSDLFDGITLTLFQAEEETQIKLDIEKDLASAKTAIQGFVDAYNALKSSLNEQSKTDSTTGTAAEDAGVLFGSSAIFGVTTSLSSVFSQATTGVDNAFKVLAQVGITFVDNNSVADPLLLNTLEIDSAKLDEALLNNPNDVRRLFAFDFSTADPRISLLGFSGQTSFNASGYKLNINFDDQFQSQAFTDGGSFSELDATTAGPAGDGVSAIAFIDATLSGNAYRYSYDSATEDLTLTDLTSGTSQTIDITTTLDGIGDGGDLDAGETAAFNFSNLGVTLTLTGDGSPTTNFKRGTDIITSGSLTVNATNITVIGSAGVVTDGDGGVTQTGLAELKVLADPSIYDQATGKLTVNFDSSGAGNLVLAAAGTAGLEFSVDSGAFSAAPAANMDDAGSHTIDVRLAASQEVIARITVNDVDGTGAAGTLDFDIGTGLFAETSTKVSSTSPIENYLALGAGNQTFDIKDSSNTVIGTVAYNKTDNLQDLATAITSSVANVTATIVSSGGTFKIEIIHDTRDTLTFVSDTDNLVTALNIANTGDAVFSANFGGAAGGEADLSAAVNGRTITALGLTGAEGLQVFYNGASDLASVQLDFTTGFGERLFFAIDAMLAPITGLMNTSVASLTKQNDVRQDRVDDMVKRLEVTQATLLQKFINMEVALARSKNLLDTLTQTFDAMFASKN